MRSVCTETCNMGERFASISFMVKLSTGGSPAEHFVALQYSLE